MRAKFTVSGLSDNKTAQDLKEAIKVHESDAKVDMDFDNQTIMVESAASKETFREVIVASGYQIQSES